jgi:CRISPR/Cas system-associated protein Csm6
VVLKPTAAAFSKQELHILQKQLSQEERAIRKMELYEGQVESAELKKVISSMKEKHREHHDILSRHLQTKAIQ